ncbi:MAG: class I SAM-dependent methyltransferase [bacterium]|nr:class I SAM-dependent methyltransferase [bacterium]
MRSPSAETSADIRAKLHHEDPYAGFDATAIAPDLQGWNGNSPFFGELINKLRPQLVLEVGSWKGQSAATMGRALQQLGGERTLVCVDTWLGALEFRTDHEDPERYRGLAIRHGYPQVYYQFLANMVHAGLQNTVVPFPQTSLIAARWFLVNGIGADLIYIDGSHEENDVYADLVYYWQIAKPGAVVFGDDFVAWEGVRKAVTTFAQEQGLEVGVRDNNFWILQKPA